MKRFLVVALAIAIAGCGGGEDDALVVSGASSLQTAFTAYGEDFGDVRFSFAGSDELAAQIRQGVDVDVYAAANTTLPQELFDEGLVEEPVVFAGNRLVLAVPAESEITSLDDVARQGVDIAIGAEGVPVGDYTRKVLAGRDDIFANVRSEEPDVKGIVGKLTQGAVDAGFVYVTDVKASGDALRAIELPDAEALYGVAVVKGASERAQEFVDGLREGEGREQLEAAGFEIP